MDEKIKVQPQKFPAYVFGGETQYRQIPHRTGNEDVVA